MKKFLKDPLLYILLLFMIYPFLPYIGNFISLGTELLTWFIFTLGFNLCLKYTGLVSFGHGAFYGIGSYAAALTYLHLFGGKGFFVPILLGAIWATVFAGALGFLIRNKKGIYFALLTVVFTQVLYVICWKWTEVTGGEGGLKDINRSSFLGIDMVDSINYYYFVFVLFVISALVIRRITNSNFGKSLQAIRLNPVRAACLGYNTGMYKCLVFIISGFWAGLGGALYCFLTQSVFASMLDWVRSGDAVIATVLGGGLASFYGPILGSTALIVGQELISSFWTHWRLVFGLGFVAIILAIVAGQHARIERE